MNPKITDLHENAIDVTNSTKHVPTSIDRDILWLVGLVAARSDAFGDSPVWVKRNITLSIRPGESGRQAFERQTGEKLEDREIVYTIDI